jgi:hypothetical protein
MKTARLFLYAALVAAFTLPAGAQQGAVPPATTDDTFLAEPVTAKPNLEPAIARPVQEKAASERLAALRRQHGRAPGALGDSYDPAGTFL